MAATRLKINSRGGVFSLFHPIDVIQRALPPGRVPRAGNLASRPNRDRQDEMRAGDHMFADQVFADQALGSQASFLVGGEYLAEPALSLREFHTVENDLKTHRTVLHPNGTLWSDFKFFLGRDTGSPPSNKHLQQAMITQRLDVAVWSFVTCAPNGTTNNPESRFNTD